MKSSTNNSQKPNNYAQAAAQQQPKPNSLNHNPLHKNQNNSMHQQTQPNQHSAVALNSTNFTSSVNGKSISSQQKLQSTQLNSSLSNGNNNTSSTVVKSSHPKKKLMSLPKNISNLNLPVTPIQFGSINIPTNISQSSSPIQNNQNIPILSGGALPSPLPKNVNTIFGTVKAQGSSEELVQQPSPIQQNSVNVATASSGNSSDASKNITSRIQNEIHRTQSAPPQLAHQDLVNGKINQQTTQQPSNLTTRPQPAPIVQQQSIPASHQHSLPTHHRKDSASSTVSSNDGQIHSYHNPHQPSSHHSNHNHTNQHSYNTHHRQNPHHKSGGMGSGPGQNVSGQYAPRSRDKSGPQVPITSPTHINVPQPQQVPAQPQLPQHYPIWNYRPYDMPQFYYTPPVYLNTMNTMSTMNQINQINPMAPSPFVPQQRPPMPVVQTHISTQNQSQFNTQKHSKAIQIINPDNNRPLNLNALKTPKKDEISIPNISETKKSDEIDKVKNPVVPDDKKESKAVKIVAPADKVKEDQVKKEKEEHERKVKEESERIEREKKLEEERKAKEEKERKEKEEREQKEREERERIERQRKLEEDRKAKEEQARKEKEEKERKEREEQERIERERRLEEERKVREEKERKEREEEEQRAREAERIERERILEEEKRAKEEEAERKLKEEYERKLKLEEERKLKEEAERKEREEKERKAKEEQERIERERKQGEELKAKEEAERKAKEEKDRQESERKKKVEEQLEKTSVKREEKKHDKKNKPFPLDLSRTTSAPAIPNPLGSARIIDDLSSVTYPSHIMSPNPELNSNSTPGKFKYERGFLMQFMDVCKERPDNLPPVLDAIGRDEPKDNKKSSGHRTMTNTMRGSNQHKGNSSQPPMGEFKLPGKNSEERFNISTSNINNRSSPNSGGYNNRPASLGPRSSSGSSMFPPSLSNVNNHNHMNTGRNSSGSGGKRMDNMNNRRKANQQNLQGLNTNIEPIQPLEQTKDRWVPPTRTTGTIPKVTEDQIPIDVVQRKVKALLNKLTLEKFDAISDQIIEYANKSKFEKDGRILKEIIRLIFEKSCDEINFSQMYAQLCRKMMEMIGSDITDENVKNNDGKLVTGGTLFRKYLLNRCQEDFEKGWKVNIPVPSNEKGEPDLLSDEYYSAAKAKRRGLGLIRFIGELFKLNMLTERIMHECIRKLFLNSNEIPGEEEMESLCKLLTTVGKQLDHDHDKAKNSMDVYFNRMDEMSKNKAFSSRIRFMLLDVIELRNNKWIPRRDNNAPKTISEIHEDAAKQKEEAAETLRRTASSGGRGMPKIAEQMSRSGSGRRDLKGSQTHGPNSTQSNNEGWSTVGAPSSRKTIDISKFGSVSRGKAGPVNLGPTFMSSAKGWKVENKEREEKPTNMARTNSTANMYNVLNHVENLEGKKNVENPAETLKSSQNSERKRIILNPRTLPKDEVSDSPPKTTDITSSVPLVVESNAVAKTSASSMPFEQIEKKIRNIVEEYFSVLDINEVLMCVKELPIEYHSKSIEDFANVVIEKKQEDVRNVIKLFKKLVSDNIVKKSNFKEGLIETMNFLVEIGADAPFAYEFTGQLLCGAKMDFKDIPDLFKPLIELEDYKGTEKVMKGYLNTSMEEMGEQSILKMVNESNFDFKLVIKKPIDKYLEDFGLGILNKTG